MLTPYSQKLNLSDARHLLGRVTFASSWKTIKSFENLTAAQAVKLLFDNALKNPAPSAPAWKDDAFKMFWTLPKMIFKRLSMKFMAKFMVKIMN